MTRLFQSQNEYARLLVKMRTVRDQLNLRLSQSSQVSHQVFSNRALALFQKSQSSQDMGDAKTILRVCFSFSFLASNFYLLCRKLGFILQLEFLMEENNKLKSRIMTLSNALRSNWSDEVR